MKVFVIGSLAESLVNFRGDMLRLLVARGHAVVALAPPGPDWVQGRLASWGVRYIPLPISRAGTSIAADWGLLCQLRRLFRVERPDVTLGYTIKPVVYGSIAAWLAGVPRVAAMVTGLGFTFMPASSWKARAVQTVARLLYRAGLACTDVIFFQNSDDEAEFRKRGLIPARARVLRINGSGVHLGRYAMAALPGGPMRFLMVGRLITDKGVREYIEAAKHLRSSHPQARCDLVGPPDDNPAALTPVELAQAVASGAIHYHGVTQDVRPFIRDCHVFVLPSYREGTPRSVLEAMAMGRPVLTTDAPGCRDTVVPGETGMLVAVRDAGALARAMDAFCDMPHAALVRQGQAARARAEAIYDVSLVNGVIAGALLDAPAPDSGGPPGHS